jgi:hypothetical protein
VPLTLREALVIARDVASAMIYLHAPSDAKPVVVHRDLVCSWGEAAAHACMWACCSRWTPALSKQLLTQAMSSLMAGSCLTLYVTSGGTAHVGVTHFP